MLASFFSGLNFILPLIFNLITILIIASVVMSWVNADPYNPYVQQTRKLTEPLFRPFRRFTQGFSGPIDLAPLLALFTLYFIQAFLLSLLPKVIHFLS
mgnify:CR=1 FL=1